MEEEEEEEGGVGGGRPAVLFCKCGQKPTETNAVADELSHTLHPILSRNHLCYPTSPPPLQTPHPHPHLDNVRHWHEPCYIRER